MADRTWRRTTVSRADIDAVRGLASLGDAEYLEEQRDTHTVTFEEGDAIVNEELATALIAAGIPYVSNHGSCAGAFPAYTSAYDGIDSIETHSTEDGDPIAVFYRGIASKEIAQQVDEAQTFWLIYTRAMANMAARAGNGGPQ